MSPALDLYRLLTWLAEPLAPRLLAARARRGKEDASRVGERLGRAGLARPAGDLVWFHGASVGETLSLLPLIERFRAERPDLILLVTSGTVTSAELLRRRLPDGVLHQFAPVDGPRAVAEFLDHWRPSLGVFVEGEIWPNLLRGAKARGVRLALVSARVTETAFRGWRRFPTAARAVFGVFDGVWAHDGATRDRLAALGVSVAGLANLKRVGAPLPFDPDLLETLKAQAAGRTVVVAASTHPGEERAIAEAVAALDDPPLLILIPRHPERGAAVLADLSEAGLSAGLRSSGHDLTTVHVADTLGEMGAFLRLADIVVMGGSFAAPDGNPSAGGHNPLEPARLGKPILSGPDVRNWTEVTRDLEAAGGLLTVTTPADLTAALAPLLADAGRRAEMGARLLKAAETGGDDLETLWTGLSALAPQRAARARA